LTYKIITEPKELVRLGWQELVETHPDGTVFQSPEMYALFCAASRMKAVAVGLADEDNDRLEGVVLGVIIKEMRGPVGYFSSRTVVYGGPLVRTDTKDRDKVLDILLGQLILAVKYRSVFIQFRNFREMDAEKPLFKKHRFSYRERLNYLVDTRSEEIVKKYMGSEKARQVRKGERNGAMILPPASEDEVRAFYRILEELYKTKVKKPLPDWSFFREFYRLSEKGKLGTILLVKQDGKVIGGILCPVTPGRTIYEWYVCGLDQVFKESYPSVLATWAAIDHALKNGIPSFDFMGVGIPGRSYGVRTFKARFGGRMVNYGRFARINNRLLYFISEMGYNLWALLRGM